MCLQNIIKSQALMAMTMSVAIGLAFVATPVFAADTKTKAPAKAKKSWVKFCEDIKIKEVKTEKTVSKKVCMTLHEQRINIRTGVPLISVAIRSVTGHAKERFMVTVPLGMVIPTGMGIKIDKEKVIKLNYTYCHGVGCVAEYAMTPELMKSLKSGKDMAVITVGILNGKTIGFKVPLNGFGSAHGGKALDAKKYTKARNATIVEMRKRYVAQLKKKQAEKDAELLKNADKAPVRNKKK